MPQRRPHQQLPKLEKTPKANKRAEQSATRDSIQFTAKVLPDSAPKRTWKTYAWYSVLAVLGCGLLASLSLFVYILLILKDLPSPEDLANYSLTSTTKILARDGSLLYEVGDDGERRTVVKLEQINQHMVDATLAAEDDEFFSHPGFEWKGIIYALYRDALNKITGSNSVQGGSTITQQFVKNAFLTPEKTLKRKLSELILSVELEQHFSKKEILEMYLNKIFYGAQSYGVQAAAKTYFQKDAKDLTIAQSATLAAIAQLPGYYSPYTNKDALLKRVKFILDRMHAKNFLNDAEYKKATSDEITFAPFHSSIKAPHFVFYILRELSNTYGNELQGLNVYTSLDPALQDYAEQVVKAGALKNEKSHGVTNAALVSLDAKTGEILSMVGSRDYWDEKIDGKENVALDKRQPGSSFKPFTYATLFTKGFGTGTVFFDAKTDFGNGYMPVNYDGQFRGPVTVRSALANSLNIPAVAAQYLAKVEDTLSQVHDMGVDYLDRDDASHTGLSLALGVEEITPLDMAKAYSVFANNGKKIEVGGIIKITTDQDKLLWERTVDQGKQVLDPQAAYLINNILSDNSARPATWSNLFIPNRTVAVKTGTSIDIVNNVKKPKDLWTVGYTPSVVTAVWAGNNQGDIPVLTADGVTNAASIWKAFMIKALERTEVETFPRPDQIKEVAISTLTGLLPGAGTPIDKIRTELFPDYGVPTKTEQDFLSARVDQISGLLANDQCPDNVAMYVYQNFHSILYYNNPQDPALKRWEDAVQAWATQFRAAPPAPTTNATPATATTDSNTSGLPIVYVDSPDKIPTAQCQVMSPQESGIEMITPFEGSKVTVGPNRATFTLRSASSIQKIAAYFDNKLINSQDFPPFDQIVFTVPESQNGSIHTLRFLFTLNDNKQVSIQSGVIVGEDSNPPQITFLEPSERTLFHPGDSFQISADVTDDKGVARVEFMFDTTSIISLENAPYTSSFTIPIDIARGNHEVTVKAFDKEGNVSRLSKQLNIDTSSTFLPGTSASPRDVVF